MKYRRCRGMRTVGDAAVGVQIATIFLLFEVKWNLRARKYDFKGI
jgi:hypothetical protein